jgi:phospholipid/cholesterol/gamma-HCH transport system substrate-binding protein
MVNIRKSSKGLNENMNAAKHNFLLKGYFNKKAKAEQTKKDSLDKVKAKEQKRIDKENKKK